MGSSRNYWKGRYTCRTTWKKALGEELTDGIYLVLASKVDTVGAFNIGIGIMLLIIRNISDLESAKRVLMAHSALVLCALILSALYNQLFLGGGPPIPVLVLLISSLTLALYGLKKGTL